MSGKNAAGYSPGGLVQYGPVNNSGYKVVDDGENIFCKDYVFERDSYNAFFEKEWKASWIWLDGKVFPEYQDAPISVFDQNMKKGIRVVMLRKEFDLPFDIATCGYRVSADTRYRLFINGKLSGRGPSDVTGDYDSKLPPKYWYYDFYDNTRLFKKGMNVIVAEVAIDTDIADYFSMGSGGFLFDAEFAGQLGESLKVFSDHTWKGVPNKAYNGITYDARLFDEGSFFEGFDESQWRTVDVIGSPEKCKWKLQPREVPYPMEIDVKPAKAFPLLPEMQTRFSDIEVIIQNGLNDNPGRAAQISEGPGVTLWLDFGRELSGYVQFSIKGNAGTYMSMSYYEVPWRACGFRNYYLKDGWQAYETFAFSGFQYLAISFDRVSGPIEIERIIAVFTSYPVDYKGNFKCSDDCLNKIWNTGRWTNQLCMQGIYLDSPIHQEPLSDPGDYLIESLINYCTFGDKWLARADLIRMGSFIEQQGYDIFHTSYTLLWIKMLVKYYMYTGDKELINRLSPIVHGILDLFETYRGNSGLIDNPPNYMFMDWVYVNEYILHRPPRMIGLGYMSAFYVDGLSDGVFISNIFGEHDVAQKYGKIISEVKKAFNDLLWVEEKGLYCDGRKLDCPQTNRDTWLPDDPATGKVFFSQQTNILAVSFDIAPKELQKDIMYRVLTDNSLTKVQPYFMHFLFDALENCGLYDKYAITQLKRWEKILSEHPSSFKEEWLDEFFCDYSHAWTGTPTYQLSSRVLGISPALPGFKKVKVKPSTGNLSWANGTVPTPFGPMRCRWESSKEQFALEIEIPDMIFAEVFIPIPEGYKQGDCFILMSGDQCESISGFSGNYYQVETERGPGTYKYVIKL